MKTKKALEVRKQKQDEIDKQRAFMVGVFECRTGHTSFNKESNQVLRGHVRKMCYLRYEKKLSRQEINYQNKHWSFDKEYNLYKSHADCCPHRQSKNRQQNHVWCLPKKKLNKMKYIDISRALSKSKSKKTTALIQDVIDYVYSRRYSQKLNVNNIINWANSLSNHAQIRIDRDEDYVWYITKDKTEEYPKNRKYQRYDHLQKVIRRPRRTKLGKSKINGYMVASKYARQKGICPYTNVFMPIQNKEYGGKGNGTVKYNSPTLSRIEHTQTYSDNNFVISSYSANCKLGGITIPLMIKNILIALENDNISEKKRKSLLVALKSVKKGTPK